jgi:hypothetical protein
VRGVPAADGGEVSEPLDEARHDAALDAVHERDQSRQCPSVEPRRDGTHSPDRGSGIVRSLRSRRRASPFCPVYRSGVMAAAGCVCSHALGMRAAMSSRSTPRASVGTMSLR